jgi:hypothetical protein
MGRRQKRLIVQADLTSEEDRQFLAWVLERRRKRRLAEEIREGLRLQYQRRMGQAPLTVPVEPPDLQVQGIVVGEPSARSPEATASKLQRLVGSL